MCLSDEFQVVILRAATLKSRRSNLLSYSVTVYYVLRDWKGGGGGGERGGGIIKTYYEY